MNPTEAHLTAEELVARWRGKVSLRTLENWRMYGGGPRFMKPQRGAVLYPLTEVIAYEQKRTYFTTKDRARG